MKRKVSQYSSAKKLPKHIANMPERQRKAMQKARKDGDFDAQAHLANSPIGRAAARGFPIPRI